MTRFWPVILLILAVAGCRAPTPSLNVFAPYGSPTVPPPGTGSIGTSGNYYAPTTPGPQAPTSTTQPATGGIPSLTPQMQPGGPAANFMGTSNQIPTSSLTDANVAQASFEPGSTSGRSSTVSAINSEVLPPGTSTPQVDAATSPSALRLNGMRVSDATQSSEPQQFTPSSDPINIADLPPANGTRSPSFLRILNTRSDATSGTPTPATPATTNSTGTWQSR